MSLDVGVSDLIRSYVRHREAARDVADGSSHLLLFYAVECGLKAAYLGPQGVGARSTSGLPIRLRTHDLRHLAKELNLDPGLYRFAACRRHHDHAVKVDHHEWHEAWRYGAALNSDDEEAAVAALEALIEWCRKEHSR